jgi:hypothetical protein
MAQVVSYLPPTAEVRFVPWLLYVGFVVDKVALEQVFFESL